MGGTALPSPWVRPTVEEEVEAAMIWQTVPVCFTGPLNATLMQVAKWADQHKGVIVIGAAANP